VIVYLIQDYLINLPCADSSQWIWMAELLMHFNVRLIILILLRTHPVCFTLNNIVFARKN